jgi:hypothetical protein
MFDTNSVCAAAKQEGKSNFSTFIQMANLTRVSLGNTASLASAHMEITLYSVFIGHPRDAAEAASHCRQASVLQR